MARLGPFGPAPRLAVGVSGGADSTALACLATAWTQDRAGSVLALIADHGLRPESAAEAHATAARLAALGLETRILGLDIAPGSGLQARAREARHNALASAAREAGIVHLLLGHHAGDQAELLAMRAARGTGGAEGMAAFSARHDVAILRPLLDIDPSRLRDFLTARGVAWVEDPSNRNPAFERVRQRMEGCVLPADMPARRAAQAGRLRDTAGFLSRYATIRPEAYALVDADRLSPDVLAALFRVLGGTVYPPRQVNVAALAHCLRPATLGGVEIVPAGRLGVRWLLCREASACAGAVPVTPGAVWDGRFRVVDPPAAWEGASIGALGRDAATHRARRTLPARVLRGLPAIRRRGEILAVPHLDDGGGIVFTPPMPLVPWPFAGCDPAMSAPRSVPAT